MAVVPAVGRAADLRCTLADARIGESSGVAAASWSDDVVFTHNDSGDAARFFAVDGRTCATRATYTVVGATSIDWEDMARGTASDGSPVLWLADIGDNRARRPGVVVYEVAEPAAADADAALAVRSRWELTYPDGPHDAETLLVDPETGRPVVVTKDLAGGRSRAYRVPRTGSGVLEPLAQLDVKALPGGGLAGPAWSVTGGATSPDRRTVVLRTYLAAWAWSASPGEALATVLARPPATVDVPFTHQPEAISFTRDGHGLWVTSEGVASPLHLVPFPPADEAPRTTEPSTPAPTGAAGTNPSPSGGAAHVLGPVVAAAGAMVLGGSLVVGALLARRRRRA